MNRLYSANEKMPLHFLLTNNTVLNIKKTIDLSFETQVCA